MRVRALMIGTYNNRRRRPGDVFDLRPRKGVRRDKETNKLIPIELTVEQQFSKVWMEKVTEDTPTNRPTTFRESGLGDARAQRETPVEGLPPKPSVNENFTDDDPNAAEAEAAFEEAKKTHQPDLAGVEKTEEPTGSQQPI